MNFDDAVGSGRRMLTASDGEENALADYEFYHLQSLGHSGLSGNFLVLGDLLW